MAETDVKYLCKWNKKLLILVYFTYFIFLGIAGCFAYRTFHPQEISVPESISVNIVCSNGKNNELSDEGKGYLKEQLHTALMEVSGKAEAAYNEKFATLLTILAVFGIAWPLIITYLQNMSLERDRTEIAEAKNKAVETLQKNQSIMLEMQGQEKEIQDQRKEINEVKRDVYMQFAIIYIQSVMGDGLVIGNKRCKGPNNERYPLHGVPGKVTRAFQMLIEVVNAFCNAELIIPSKDAHKRDSLMGIKDVSLDIYHLSWNYDDIIYHDVVSELDGCISNVEKIDHNLEEIPQALQNLRKAKELLEEDHAKQQAANTIKNESQSNGD